MNSPYPECCVTFEACPYALTTSIDLILHWLVSCDLVPELDPIISTEFRLFTKFREDPIEHLLWVRHATTGRIFLPTPSPVPIGNCSCSNFETSLFCTFFLCFQILIVEHPSILLICLGSKKCFIFKGWYFVGIWGIWWRSGIAISIRIGWV